MKFALNAAVEDQAPQVVFGVRVSRNDPVEFESLPVLGERPVEAVEYVIALEGTDMPYQRVLVGTWEAWLERAAVLALTAVRDAGWPAGCYLADVIGNNCTAAYTGRVEAGMAVHVAPVPPF